MACYQACLLLTSLATRSDPVPRDSPPILSDLRLSIGRGADPMEERGAEVLVRA